MVSDTDGAEWHKIDGSGPTYRYRFAGSSGPGGRDFQLESDEHHTIAVYSGAANNGVGRWPRISKSRSAVTVWVVITVIGVRRNDVHTLPCRLQ
jgi:hypothetical protein